ncbi:MAG TPA: copper chaperone PCu(A)C [Hyphomicrobiaceae bacterium]|nr:copper chaperone PCu(A)C [Hyphomicrobiaceae bacterium]
MLRRLLALLLAAAMAAPAAAHSHKKKGLEIVHPWTPAQPDGAGSARVFMIIKNGSGKPDRLLSASTQRADKVELQSAGKGAAAFVVRHGKELTLYGNGPSLVLTGLKAPLHAYGDFKMTLVFEKAGPVAIDVMVEE